MSVDGELWHIVEARRDDGTPTMFRIRELAPKKELSKIFVVELPYPTTEMSRLPNATAYRRLAELEEQWLRPACGTLGWELVGTKTEDGSFFVYMYGGSDPQHLIEKVSPFDAGLGFYDDEDPDWQEYGTLRELLDQAKAIPSSNDEPGAAKVKPASKRTVKPKTKPRVKAKAKANKTKASAKARPTAKAKRKPPKRR
jgi:hypothetical protein